MGQTTEKMQVVAGCWTGNQLRSRDIASRLGDIPDTDHSSFATHPVSSGSHPVLRFRPFCLAGTSGDALQASHPLTLRFSGGPMSPPIRMPIRFWMTGCLAIVTAALGTHPARARTESDADISRHRGRSAMVSPFGVEETVCKIQAAAEARGLNVFARVRGRSGGEPSTLVLGSSGVTPVLLDGPGAPLELPLKVEVSSRRDGRTEVRFDDLRQHERRSEIPVAAVESLPPLPEVIEAALGPVPA